MRIFRRITDILSANLNDLVEQWEDPERMLRQAVRELEDAVEKTRRAAVTVVADEKLLARQIECEQAERAAWLRRAEQALRQEKDELARRALRHKAAHEKIVAALEDQHKSATTTSMALRRQLEAMRVKLADAQRRLAAASAQRRALETRHQLLAAGASGANTTWRFETFARRLDRFEAETSALAELGDMSFEEVQEFQWLDEPDVEEELETLKRSIRPESS